VKAIEGSDGVTKGHNVLDNPHTIPAGSDLEGFAPEAISSELEGYIVGLE
jgi:hypothetical protein